MPIQHLTERPVPDGPAVIDDVILAVNRLSYRYPDGRAALQEVSFRLRRGERVGLVGPNGAGKSTLMLHLNGLLTGDGEVEVAGVAVVPANFPLVRSKVGLVFQNPDDQLFSPTVFEDVAFGPLHLGLGEVEVRRRVEGALTQVGMETFATRQPYHLSVGEKKRVALATVLAMDPALLVLDEPSAGLDPRGRRDLIKLLGGLTQTMLIASHDVRLVAELCPRLIVMDGGRLVADGETAELLADAPFLEAHGLEQP